MASSVCSQHAAERAGLGTASDLPRHLRPVDQAQQQGRSDVDQAQDQAQDGTRSHELAERTRRRLREGRAAGGPALHQAQAEVIADHLWLARAVAHRYRYRGEDDDDLLQVACVGLVEAVQRFDPEQGDFLSFAVPTVAGLVKRHFRDHGWLVRPPRRTQELVAGMRREWSSLAQELAHAPNDQQLAARLGEAAADVTEARCASQGYSSLSIDVLTEEHGRVGVADGREVDRVDARIVVQRAVAQLAEEDRRLIWMRFFEGRSQSDIAAETGTSQMQVSRRLTRLLARLRTIVGVEERTLLAS